MFNYHFEIAGLRINIKSPAKILFQSSMLPFQVDDATRYDLIYEIVLKEKEIEYSGVIARNDFSIAIENGRFIQLRKVRTSDRLHTIALQKLKKNQYLLQIPVQMLKGDVLFSDSNILNFLELEDALLGNQAFILHSSFVAWNKSGILFTAPSGTGKSTQADLWKVYESADIYNGDRTILRKCDEGYIGYGLPYAGSSKIYRNDSAPIKIIVVLSQASENRIWKLQGGRAFSSLYRETIINTWNPEYMVTMTDLLMDVVKNVPIYHLACRPDKEAVELVKQTIVSL